MKPKVRMGQLQKEKILTTETAHRHTENIWLFSSNMYVYKTACFHEEKNTWEPEQLLKAMTKGRCPSKTNLLG